MPTNLKQLGIFLLLTILVFSSCRKDSVIEDDMIINPEPGVFVNGSISGLVIDESNMPVENASVSLGTEMTLTDANGQFLFKNVTIDSKGSLVTAEKEGYFYNAKLVHSKLNKFNFTKFKLIEKTLSGTFESASAANISTNGGAEIEFAANSIRLENGGAYTGQVNVYATWLDPTAQDLALRSPGDLRAYNAANEQVQLATYGMMGVELEGENGQALNLAAGQVATINLPVPVSLQGSAPATIPLWHFDETIGYWVEEGQATLQGDQYIGTVSHFSFWNWDIPSEVVYIDGVITDEGGVGIEDLQVELTQNSNAITAYGWTNEDGVYEGWVPQDEALTMKIYDNCGAVMYSTTIGPFSNDTSVPEFSIGSTSNTILTISGNLVNCDNSPVSNGYAKLEYGNSYSILNIDANGSFNSTISICGETEITITGYDLDAVKQSSAQIFTIDNMTDLNTGMITVCEDLDTIEYLNYSIGDDNFIIVDPFAQYSPSSGYVNIFGESSNPLDSLNNILLGLPSASVGNIFSPQTSEMTGWNGSDQIYASCINSTCSEIDVILTTLEPNGGFIIGSYTGVISDTIPVSGNFKVLFE